MPELPEVETIRRQAQEKITGKTIAGIDVLEKKSFIGDKNAAVGKTVSRLGRCAKVLQIIFKDGSALLMHFKLTGQLLWRDAGASGECRFARVVIRFNGGSRLVFCDARKFGWVKAVPDYKKECAAGAIEPFRDDFTQENFSRVLKKSRRPIKIILMDQAVIGGIGNIYANEALFLARIDPFRPANTLTAAETKKLHAAILNVLKKAIACKGSSGKDEWYRQLNGLPGCYQEHFLVYQRGGKKCFGCVGKVTRKNLGGRGTFYCPVCQR